MLVTLLAVFPVERIVEAGLQDHFLGLILFHFIKKAAEHFTAVDEAWDGQMVRNITDVLTIFVQMI